jgi:hypothetical protein
MASSLTAINPTMDLTGRLSGTITHGINEVQFLVNSIGCSGLFKDFRT